MPKTRPARIVCRATRMARGSPREVRISVRESQIRIANCHLSTPPNPQSRARPPLRVGAVIVARQLLAARFVSLPHNARQQGGCGSAAGRNLRCGGRLALSPGPHRATRKGFLPASLPNQAALLAEQAARNPAGNLFNLASSRFAASPRRRFVQSWKSLRRLQYIIRKKELPVRRHHHDLYPVAQPLRHRQLH
jgi:hypothetical protein